MGFFAPINEFRGANNRITMETLQRRKDAEIAATPPALHNRKLSAGLPTWRPQ
jgi:hypothetical protein